MRKPHKRRLGGLIASVLGAALIWANAAPAMAATDLAFEVARTSNTQLLLAVDTNDYVELKVDLTWANGGSASYTGPGTVDLGNSVWATSFTNDQFPCEAFDLTVALTDVQSGTSLGSDVWPVEAGTGCDSTKNYAKVTGYAPHSPDANHPDYWGENCVKVSPGGYTYTLPAGTYTKVIVKAGANQEGNYANTIFAAPPKAGEIVWADSNGNGTFDDGDKTISHVILCSGAGGETPPPPTEVTATAPTSVDKCGTANDTFTIPSKDGVVYKVDGNVVAAGTYPGTGKVTVTASAEEGFVLKGDSEWTFEFTNVACETNTPTPTPTTTSPTPTPTETTPTSTPTETTPVPTDTPSYGGDAGATGVSPTSGSIPWTAYIALIMGVVLVISGMWSMMAPVRSRRSH